MEEEKKKILERQKKFGIITNSEDGDRLKARKERFGIVNDDEKKQKRAERFNLGNDEDKLRKRAQRFKNELEAENKLESDKPEHQRRFRRKRILKRWVKGKTVDSRNPRHSENQRRPRQSLRFNKRFGRRGRLIK